MTSFGFHEFSNHSLRKEQCLICLVVEEMTRLQHSWASTTLIESQIFIFRSVEEWCLLFSSLLVLRQRGRPQKQGYSSLGYSKPQIMTMRRLLKGIHKGFCRGLLKGYCSKGSLWVVLHNTRCLSFCHSERELGDPISILTGT